MAHSRYFWHIFLSLGLLQQIAASWQADLCPTLTSLSLENTTILEASYVTPSSNISTPGTCQATVSNSVEICRVYGVINTTSTSSVKFEAWLPDTWYGRFLSTGNGGLGGCIDYANLDYGTTLHFATIGSDGGHDGYTGLPFLHHPEVINDFAHRSIHIATVVGKQIVEAYYASAPSKSYYLGCSAGGRQAIQSALLHPNDFDGIVGGDPAINWNIFMGVGGITSGYFGAPNPESSDKFIPSNLWKIVTQEILRQCDALDGLVDGFIAEPDDCDFNPDPLLCVDGHTDDCLTKTQVHALRMFYRPIYGTHGQLLWPRADPGSEVDKELQTPIQGNMLDSTTSWARYAVYNDSKFSMDNYSISNVEYGNTINPGGIATWNGNFSAFRNHGGKFLTYHGRSDIVVPSGNSKRFYELVSSTLSLPNLDDFYRLFLVPGMFHCQVGGAWAFGQGAMAGAASNVFNDTAHNILLAMVDWVEGGVAPDTIIGVDDQMVERVHCRYPHKTMWTGRKWICT